MNRKLQNVKFASMVFLLCGVLIMMMPFVWMVLASFKTLGEILRLPVRWLPDSFRFTNYAYVLERLNFFRYYVNTVLVTSMTLAGQLIICSLAAYSFARLSFPGKNFIFMTVLAVLMVPFHMTVIPKYLIIVRLGWLDSYQGIIVPLLFSPYGVFLLKQAFQTMPRELEESAKMDGCSYLRIYSHIVMPLNINSLIALGIIIIMATWNDLLWPLIVIISEGMRVISIGMAALQGEFGTEYHLLMAASVMATFPILMVFVFGQKHFLEGVTLSGLKG